MRITDATSLIEIGQKQTGLHPQTQIVGAEFQQYLLHHCCITAVSLLYHCYITAISGLYHCCMSATPLLAHQWYIIALRTLTSRTLFPHGIPHHHCSPHAHPSVVDDLCSAAFCSREVPARSRSATRPQRHGQRWCH